MANKISKDESKRRKTPGAVRKEAAALARYVAEQRARDGDPEGSEIIRDLARSITTIELMK